MEYASLRSLAMACALIVRGCQQDPVGDSGDLETIGLNHRAGEALGIPRLKDSIDSQLTHLPLGDGKLQRAVSIELLHGLWQRGLFEENLSPPPGQKPVE